MSNLESAIEKSARDFAEADKELRDLYAQLLQVQTLSSTHSKGVEALSSAMSVASRQVDAIRKIEQSVQDVNSKVLLATDGLTSTKFSLDQLVIELNSESFKEMSKSIADSRLQVEKKISELGIRIEKFEQATTSASKNTFRLTALCVVLVVVSAIAALAK